MLFSQWTQKLALSVTGQMIATAVFTSGHVLSGSLIDLPEYT